MGSTGVVTHLVQARWQWAPLPVCCLMVLAVGPLLLLFDPAVPGTIFPAKGGVSSSLALLGPHMAVIGRRSKRRVRCPPLGNGDQGNGRGQGSNMAAALLALLALAFHMA